MLIARERLHPVSHVSTLFLYTIQCSTLILLPTIRVWPDVCTPHVDLDQLQTNSITLVLFIMGFDKIPQTPPHLSRLATHA